MPGPTARKLVEPAVPNPLNASMMPRTVPNNPINGHTAAAVASQFMFRSSRVISSLIPICKLRSRATRLVSLERDAIWRLSSL